MKQADFVLSSAGSLHAMSRMAWRSELLRLYIDFKTEEGHEPPQTIVPFDRRLITRFLVVAPTTTYRGVGMATLITRPDGLGTSVIGVVEDVYVMPEHRGQGYCTRLIETLIAEARRVSLIRLELTSNPNKQARTAAIRIYEKLGFKYENPQTGGTSFYRLNL